MANMQKLLCSYTHVPHSTVIIVQDLEMNFNKSCKLCPTLIGNRCKFVHLAQLQSKKICTKML